MLLFLGLFVSMAIAVLPLPSFADRTYILHTDDTLVLGCDVDIFIATTTFQMDKDFAPRPFTATCEKAGGYYPMHKGDSVAFWCYHDNILIIGKHVKMSSGEKIDVKCEK